jgi:hypothetical protein
VTKPFKPVKIQCPVCHAEKETPLFLAWDIACEYPQITAHMAVPHADPALVGMQAATDAMQGPRRCKKCGASFFLFYSVITRQLRTATKEWLEELKNGETAQHEGSGTAGHDSGVTGQQATVEDTGGPQAEGLQEREQEAPPGDKPGAAQRAD